MKQVSLFPIVYVEPLIYAAQALTAKINKSIERSMVNAASSGKLTIMKNATDECVWCFITTVW
jgi:hypothetical protein